MASMSRPVLALLGPTASGKTEASIAMASALGAEVVAVDSMLVYRGMDAGTAKPTAAQRSAVPHHLIDLFEPSEAFSVSTYQSMAREAIEAIRSRGHEALLVGSGGLYYRSVVDDLAFAGTDPATRRLLHTEARSIGPAALHERLRDLDAAAASRIDPSNARRTVRALEVAAVSGRPFSSFAAAWERYPADRVVAAAVDVPRPILHRRIEERTRGMIPRLLDEAAALAHQGFERLLTASQAIGYPEAMACLRGEIDAEEAASRIVRRTKALARRQLSWLRRDPRVVWFESGEGGAADVEADVLGFFEAAVRRTPVGART
jgi:tRNA dimethylallyltransferase